MTCNFSLLALDQIVNNAATLRHMSGGQVSVPVVFRMATGAGRQVAGQHSHSFEGLYAHVPGLRVLAAATLEDARWMLGAALRQDDPTIIFENAVLYPLEGEVPENTGQVDLEHARIRRPGRHVSLITQGASLYRCLEAAQLLSARNIEAEVLDLRSLRPLDEEAIVATVRRTRHAVVVDEGWRSVGLAAEVSARIMEQAFFELDAPVQRVCSLDVPIPYAKHLEDAALPSPARILAAVQGLFAGGGA
jgi:pyruvate/2-oxoglutarate/acetoin dehydrogenase E1 component